jgi:anti-sigma factor RsiW
MSSSLEFIDAYFSNQLSTDERIRFEKQCEDDPDFASEVSFYIMSRAQLKATVRHEKAQNFRGLHQDLSSRRPPSAMSRNITPYLIAAAASILIFVLVIVNWDSPPERLADAYIDQNFDRLGVTRQSSARY